MLVRDYREVEAKTAEGGAEKTTVRWLISKKEGAPNFAMRLFEIGPEGYTPLHKHPWEHEAFVLEGEGVISSEQGEHPISSGSVVFVPEDELHQFKNTGTDPLRILCMIPAGHR